MLYLDNGYVDISYCMGFGCPLTILIGGRATGKTYGSLKWIIENNHNMILMRRTQSQTDLINKPEFSPINPVANDMDLTCKTKPISKYNSAIYLISGEEENPIGFTAALSTFSNLRGFDASGVDILLYDEFIPETHERPIKGEADAFFNVYETVNRNRELQGRPALRALLLSNANRLDAPILSALGLVGIVDKMVKNGRSEYVSPQRGIAVFLLQDSPISNKKANTTIYKMTEGSKFSKMSLTNAFAYDDMSDVTSMPLNGWKLFAQLGNWFFYKKENRWYMSAHGSGTAKYVFEDTEIDKRKFALQFPACYSKILNHLIYFESFDAKSYLTSLYI